MIAAAEQQLETAGGVEDTPFVTITVTIDAADSTKRIVSAYQVLDNSFYTSYHTSKYLKSSFFLIKCDVFRQCDIIYDIYKVRIYIPDPQRHALLVASTSNSYLIHTRTQTHTHSHSKAHSHRYLRIICPEHPLLITYDQQMTIETHRHTFENTE